MSIWVRNTDSEWFRRISKRVANGLRDVNFWIPSGKPMRAQPGELVLFKNQKHQIVGGGFFSRNIYLPVQFAWEYFESANGADSKDQLKQLLSRHMSESVTDATKIGCAILNETFVFSNGFSFPALHKPLGPVKKYDENSADGQLLLENTRYALQSSAGFKLELGPAIENLLEPAYGTPLLVAPRLGQAAFRAVVLDAYGCRCCITRERTLPVLEAAHIRRYSSSGDHSLANGLLLRSDLHRLFDGGYIGVDPRHNTLIVSSRIREEFENGRDYYAWQGKPLHFPTSIADQPSRENLQYHAENIFC